MGPLVSHVQKEVCIFLGPCTGCHKSHGQGPILRSWPSFEGFALCCGSEAPMLTDPWQHEGCLW